MVEQAAYSMASKSAITPRQRTVFAGRHVIIGFQLEIYNSPPVPKDILSRQSPIILRLILDISQVHLSVDVRFWPPNAHSGPESRGSTAMSLPGSALSSELAGSRKDVVKISRGPLSQFGPGG
jgi:hypothetical protein